MDIKKLKALIEKVEYCAVVKRYVMKEDHTKCKCRG